MIGQLGWAKLRIAGVWPSWSSPFVKVEATKFTEVGYVGGTWILWSGFGGDSYSDGAAGKNGGGKGSGGTNGGRPTAGFAHARHLTSGQGHRNPLELLFSAASDPEPEADSEPQWKRLKINVGYCARICGVSNR